MYVLRGILVVTMRCSIDSLDVCFGAQLANSRGGIGVDACLRPTFSDRNFGVILCCMLRDFYVIQL